MATPIENSRYAGGMFDNLRGSFNNYLSTQAAIAQQAQQERQRTALMNLKRMQELEDQGAEAKLKTDLTNLTVKGQLAAEELRAKRERERLTAYEESLDKKLTADEKKKVVAAVRAIYAQYKGTKKITDFGPEDDPNTLYALQAEVVKDEKTALEGSLKADIENLRQRKDMLLQSVDVKPGERESLLGQIADSLGGEAKNDKAYKNYLELTATVAPSVAIKLMAKQYPQFARAAQMGLESAVGQKRAEKAEAPEFKMAFRSLMDEEGRVNTAARQSNLSNLLRVEPPAAPPKDKTASAKAFDAGGGTKNVPTPQRAPYSETDLSNLSLAGLYRNRDKIADFALQTAAIPGRVIDTAGLYGGAGVRGLLTGNYAPPAETDKGVIERLGVALGNLYPSPYNK